MILFKDDMHVGPPTVAAPGSAIVIGGSAVITCVSRPIQLLAAKYCRDCKAAFDELSRIVQKILICRRELVRYDRSQGESGVDEIAGGQDSLRFLSNVF